MSAPPTGTGETVTDYRQLVEYLEAGCKPASDWRIGTEHEKFGFCKSSLRPLPYDGDHGIRALLDGLADTFDWQRVFEGENVIALVGDRCNVTLEPGGQFELSGAPLKSVHQTCSEVHSHLAQVREVADPLNIGMLGLGFQPKWARDDISWMPKGRYKIMGAYMPTRGNLGLDMMLRTCTVQVNLDFASETDMVKKLRVSLALQPIATALFANSPFTEGKPNGFLSFRSHIWTDTDPDRCGILPFVFEDGMSFERYVDHVLDVPMYFIYRDGNYIDCSGMSFRDFLKGELPALPGELPTMSDWSDHLTTLFPEARLKRYIEMRGADGGPWRSLCALPALWVGLLYDSSSLDAAWDLCKDWTLEEHRALRRDVPKYGLAAKHRQTDVGALAARLLDIAESGLAARANYDWDGVDERKYLLGLRKIVNNRQTPADRLLEQFHGDWGGDIDRVFSAYAY